VSETVSTESILPIPIRLDLVDKDRPVLASVTLEVTLPVAVDVEAPDHAPALNWILPDRRINGLPAPCDVAWKTDVNRHESRHQCFLSGVVDRSKPFSISLRPRSRSSVFNIAIPRFRCTNGSSLSSLTA